MTFPAGTDHRQGIVHEDTLAPTPAPEGQVTGPQEGVNNSPAIPPATRVLAPGWVTTTLRPQ